MTLTTSASPYTGSSVTIQAGVTLDAQPGVTIKLTGTLTVKGTLDINGSGVAPVIFTSSSDSAPGQWTGIVLQGGAGASQLRHAEIRYAKTAISISGGIAPSINNSFIHHASTTGISIAGNGAPEIAQNQISDNGSHGISFAYSGTGNQLNIHGNTIERNKIGGIRVDDSGVAELVCVRFSDNVVNDNGGQAIFFEGPTVPFDIDENLLSGNVKNGIWITGTVHKSTTWEDRGFPIVLSTGNRIAGGETLTLDPGLVIKVDYVLGALRVNGSLQAEGSVTEPITFTSIKDDSVGGDTNGDGSATQPSPGDWKGLVFSSGSSASISFIELAYAGYKQPAINVESGSSFAALDHSELHHNAGGHPVLRVSGGISPSLTHLKIHQNHGTRGIEIFGGGSPEIAHNEVSDNSGDGIFYGAAEGNQGLVTIYDNVVERNGGDGISVVISHMPDVQGVTVSGNDVNQNSDQAIIYEGNSLKNVLPADIDENELSGNGRNGIWLAGIVESTTWEDRGFPIVLSTGNRIAGGETLTLDPGLVIKVDYVLGALRVNGSLQAEGSVTEPITFTSIKDDSVGGDTNGDGSATQPSPGDWKGLVYPSVAGAELRYVALRYAATAVDIDYLDAMVISNSDFVHNEEAIDVAQTAENNPALGALQCVPPYLSFIVSSSNWFGGTGYPAPSLDIASVVGAVIPEEYGPHFGAIASAASFSAPLYPGGDTIPFVIYSCPALGIPPIPVSPVIVTGVPAEPWFSSI